MHAIKNDYSEVEKDTLKHFDTVIDAEVDLIGNAWDRMFGQCWGANHCKRVEELPKNVNHKLFWKSN